MYPDIMILVFSLRKGADNQRQSTHANVLVLSGLDYDRDHNLRVFLKSLKSPGKVEVKATPSPGQLYKIEVLDHEEYESVLRRIFAYQGDELAAAAS